MFDFEDFKFEDIYTIEIGDLECNLPQAIMTLHTKTDLTQEEKKYFQEIIQKTIAAMANKVYDHKKKEKT